MINRYLLAITILCIMGSVLVSSLDFLSYTFKSVFYSIAFFSLIVVGFINLIRYLNQG